MRMTNSRSLTDRLLKGLQYSFFYRQNVFIFVLPGVITSLCLNTVSARTGVRHLLLAAQLSGTHWAMTCVIQQF